MDINHGPDGDMAAYRPALAPLQRVLHAAARLVVDLYDPTTTYHRPSRSCTGYRSTRGSTTSCACWSTRRRPGRRRRTSPTCWHLSPVCSHWALNAQLPTATTSCRVHIASLARGLSQSPRLRWTVCRPNWKHQPVPLIVSNALSKHFYFSLPTAVKHVLMRHRSDCRGGAIEITVILYLYLGCKVIAAWDRVPYLSALEVWLRRGAIQIYVYLYLYLYLSRNSYFGEVVTFLMRSRNTAVYRCITVFDGLLSWSISRFGASLGEAERNELLNEVWRQHAENHQRQLRVFARDIGRAVHWVDKYST